MGEPPKNPNAVPLPKLGEPRRQPHEERPSERDVPANRPACPPEDVDPR